MQFDIKNNKTKFDIFLFSKYEYHFHTYTLDFSDQTQTLVYNSLLISTLRGLFVCKNKKHTTLTKIYINILLILFFKLYINVII
ncbi:MAG: hypothetical protein UZ09_BCD002000978 [Bacteroidetes bacterium OLB9]|nr:MAG: hypothetical protein UZ09_BCD002000978 [Bacteroidetes bacterium OLB9]